MLNVYSISLKNSKYTVGLYKNIVGYIFGYLYLQITYKSDFENKVSLSKS